MLIAIWMPILLFTVLIYAIVVRRLVRRVEALSFRLLIAALCGALMAVGLGGRGHGPWFAWALFNAILLHAHDPVGRISYISIAGTALALLATEAYCSWANAEDARLFGRDAMHVLRADEKDGATKESTGP